MKKMKLMSALLAALIGLGSGAFAQDKQSDEQQSQGTQATCPVMGYEVDKEIYVDYQGKRIYVCCSECYDIVKADPAKYVEQLESQGVILEKVSASDDKKQSSPAGTGQDNSSVHQH
jgi:YHS domain-containing protein